MIEHLLVLIPAAGASRRMGRPKQLLEVGGSSLLLRACRLALSLARSNRVVRTDVLVVTGANSPVVEAHLAEANLPITVAYCADWSKGLGNSIAFGAQNALAEAATHLLVLLPDQPDIDRAYLDELLAAAAITPAPIVATAYPRGAGVPAVFPAGYRNQLTQLEGNRGARDFLRRLATADNFQLLHAPTGPPLDLDTPEEYERYARTHTDR